MTAGGAAAPPAPGARTGERAGKYPTFHRGREEFAIQVGRGREIMGVQDITAVPRTPAQVRGVINLRGKVVPVADLRLKFGLPGIEHTRRTCIIVVQVAGTAGPMPMGVVVDGVSEVLNLAGPDIGDTPDCGRGVVTPYLLGRAKIEGKVKLLLDINRVLASQDREGLEQVLSW